MRQAGDEVVEVGHVREHVVAEQQVGLRPARGELVARSRGRRSAPRVGMPCASRGLGDVGRRLDAEHRHAALDEVLQQVAVVAGDLDHLAARRRGRSASIIASA